MIQDIHDRAAALGASCPGCAPAADAVDDDDDDQPDDLAGDDYEAKIAGLTAERDALRKALARLPADRKASLRAVPVDKSADRGGLSALGEPETRDPLELTKRALRRPLTLAQIEKIANG
jgi:hypothetical protein